MRGQRLIGLGVLLAAASSAACSNRAIAADEVDIAGTYQCKGVAAGGTAYEAKVELTKAGEAYRIVWQFPGERFEGVGLREGNVLAVAYTGSYSGVVLYKILPGPRLFGRWTSPDARGQVYTETLAK